MHSLDEWELNYVRCQSCIMSFLDTDENLSSEFYPLDEWALNYMRCLEQDVMLATQHSGWKEWKVSSVWSEKKWQTLDNKFKKEMTNAGTSSRKKQQSVKELWYRMKLKNCGTGWSGFVPDTCLWPTCFNRPKLSLVILLLRNCCSRSHLTCCSQSQGREKYIITPH